MEHAWQQQIVQAQQGDLAAFDHVLKQFQDMAVGYAYSLLADFHLVEDAAQEAFVEAYFCLAGLRDPGAFPAWFRNIVFKQCDRIRRKKQLAPVGCGRRSTASSRRGWRGFPAAHRRDVRAAVRRRNATHLGIVETISEDTMRDELRRAHRRIVDPKNCTLEKG